MSITLSTRRTKGCGTCPKKVIHYPNDDLGDHARDCTMSNCAIIQDRPQCGDCPQFEADRDYCHFLNANRRFHDIQCGWGKAIKTDD